MQLSHVFTRAGQSIWLLPLVPLVALAGALTYLSGTPPEVQTFATVSVIAPEGSSTAATVTQAVDGFRSTVASDNVVQLAEEDTDTDVTGGRTLTAERVGTSNLVELRVTTQDDEDGVALVRALVSRTNDALFAAALASDAARLELADRRYEEAVVDRDKQTTSSGLRLPIEAYRAKASEVTQLRVALVTTIGDPTVDRAAVQRNLTNATKELTRIGDYVDEYESLQENVVRTRSDRASASQDLDSVRTRLEAASSDGSVTLSDPQEQSLRTTYVRGGIAALVLGTAVGAGLVLVIGLLRGPRRETVPAL